MTSSFKNIAEDKFQPNSFEFSSANKKKAMEIIKIYPQNYRESSIMPLLTLAQEQCDGWIPKKAIEHIAGFLNVSEMRVLELATFYSMYNLSPIGKYHIEICTTTPCMLRGAEKLLDNCKKKLDITDSKYNENSEFTIAEVECLGACVNAPVVKIGKHYYEDLDEVSMYNLINNLGENKKITKGSQISRKGSEPQRKAHDK